MTKIPFSDECEDLSSVQSYLFNFLCNRCGYGYQSTPVAANTSVAGSIFKVASGFFNKGMGPATNNKVQQLIEGSAHERALQAAIQECEHHFMHCSKCDSWVCHLYCWNDESDCCKNCAPIPGEAEARAKRLQPREPILADRVKVDEPASPAAILANGNGKSHSRPDETPVVELTPAAPEPLASCPKCGTANTSKGKFCHECGGPLMPKTNCSECNSKLQPGIKFCSECGAKV